MINVPSRKSMATGGTMYDYKLIIERLAHHRQRLGLTKSQCKQQIQDRYGKPFHRLTDEELINYGQFLASQEVKDG